MSDFMNNLPPSMREAIELQQTIEIPDYLKEKFERISSEQIQEPEFTKTSRRNEQETD